MEVLVVVLVIIILLIITCIILYDKNISFFVKGFRFVNNLDKKHVDLGPYKDKVINIKESSVVDIKVKDYPSVKVTFYYPNYEYDKLPVIIFIHGGGWVGGSSKKVSSFTKLLASNGYVVASIDYSLSPDYSYPVSTFQLVEALNYIYENADILSIDKDKIFIGGTSAGAHLTGQLGCLISNKDYAKEVGVNLNVPKVLGLLLINGVYNLKTVDKCKFPGIKHFCWAYLNKKDYINHEKIDEVSIINHITKSFPSVFITAGDKDPLKYQSFELVEVLKTNNIDYTEMFFKSSNLVHDFIYQLNKSDSRKTYESIIKYLDSKIK